MKKSFAILAAVLVTLCTTSAALAETLAPPSGDGVKIAVPGMPKLYYSPRSDGVPAFYTMPKNQVVTEGQNVVMEGAFTPTRDPSLTFEVFCDDKLVDLSRVTTDGKKKYESIYSFGQFIFVVKYSVPADSGRYSFRATNKLGQAVASCLVLVLEK